MTTEEVLGLVAGGTGGRRAVAPHSVRCLASVDAKAERAGASSRRQPGRSASELLTFGASDALAGVAVPNPAPRRWRRWAPPGVAEAAALSAGFGGELLMPTGESAPEGRAAMCTMAIARRPARGRLAVVGLGPGCAGPAHRPRPRRAAPGLGDDRPRPVHGARSVTCCDPGTRIEATGLGAEEERAHGAVRLAQQGLAMALIGSGDARVCAMASPALAKADTDIDVVGSLPGSPPRTGGILAAGRAAGARPFLVHLLRPAHPLGGDQHPVRAAADGDFVVTFYNPRSRARDWQLRAALDLLGAHRPASTPAAIIRNANRPGQLITVTTLGKLDTAAVDMLSLVLVGCSTTQMVAGRMVTPRGYPWQP